VADTARFENGLSGALAMAVQGDAAAGQGGNGQKRGEDGERAGAVCPEQIVVKRIVQAEAPAAAAPVV
jgi:hypothetical protein